jgi:hypothetical protein
MPMGRGKRRQKNVLTIHHRSFLYAACWLSELEDVNDFRYLPHGPATSRADVPDCGPSQTVERYAAIADAMSEIFISSEETRFRSALGIIGPLSAKQRKFISGNAERAQALQALMVDAKRPPTLLFDDNGCWQPTRDTVSTMIVGFHGLFGGLDLVREATAERLNDGIPRKDSTDCGITGHAVRNALNSFAWAHQRRLQTNSDMMTALLLILFRRCWSYHQVWQLVSTARDPTATLDAMWASGELDERFHHMNAGPHVDPMPLIQKLRHHLIGNFEALLKRRRAAEMKPTSAVETPWGRA